MSDDVTTQVYPAVGANGTTMLAEPVPSERPDGAEQWPVRTVSRGLRLRVPTAVLLALLVAGGAFWGGVALEKGHAGTGTGGFAGLAARFRTGATGTGTGTGTGTKTGTTGGFTFPGSTAAATGTVTVVEGDTLYVTTTTGSIVKVALSSSTKVTRNATATISSLKPGDTVIVQGAKASSGTVTATSVSATQAGVTTTGGLGR